MKNAKNMKLKIDGNWLGFKAGERDSTDEEFLKDIVIDGYSIGDRELEGVGIKLSVQADNSLLIEPATQSDADYMYRLNWKMYFGYIKTDIDRETDEVEFSLLNELESGDGFVYLYSSEPALKEKIAKKAISVAIGNFPTDF